MIHDLHFKRRLFAYHVVVQVRGGCLLQRASADARPAAPLMLRVAEMAAAAAGRGGTRAPYVIYHSIVAWPAHGHTTPV